MRHKPITAQIERYRKIVAEAGCIISGSEQVHLDHLFGSKAMHNKLHIGEWAIVALHPNLHQNSVINRTTNETGFYKYWDIQGDSLTECRKNLYLMQQKLTPGMVPCDIHNAILNYRK